VGAPFNLNIINRTYYKDRASYEKHTKYTKFNVCDSAIKRTES